MWPFRNKKIFKITWKYVDYFALPSTIDYIKATDIATAWNKIRRRKWIHSITLVDWEEV